ncbi:MAG TPA: adenylyl-sulfate kinase, partial [Geobacteraceae bacterium]|nr:adenylyl-sulfate kinase [Geobacteraceae bacterium]
MKNGNGILRFLACGSVDDGKSTLIGHLLHLTGNLYDDHLRILQEESARIGTAGGVTDYSLLLDGLMAEREQGITIDVAYRYFDTPGRKFIVADTPGHEHYTRNMATAASQCSAALILVDACRGVMPQTRRHALICALMGIRHLLFVVNKMDIAGWAEHVFRNVEAQCGLIAGELKHFGLSLAECVAVPVSALHGDNLVALSQKTFWYEGTTVMEWLQRIRPRARMERAAPRLPVQYVIKVARSGNAWQNGVGEKIRNWDTGTYRSYAGTLVSGRLKQGDRVVVLPSGLRTRVNEIWCGDLEVQEATAGMAVSLTLEGEHDIVRGEVIAPEDDTPEVAHLFKAQLVWMDEQPLYAGRHYLFKSLTGTATAEIIRIRNRIDPATYQRLAADHFSLNDIGEAEMALSRPIPFDPYHKNRETGGFILTDRLSNKTVGCGMIMHAMRRAGNVHWQFGEVERGERAAIKGQKPCVVWLTGLSGAGKSTIANCLERKLHGLGRHTMLLDGDNIRHGLNKDLGFTEAGRIENIRRIGEVAKLMADAGLIAITAFISPFRAERDMVRRLLP